MKIKIKNQLNVLICIVLFIYFSGDSSYGATFPASMQRAIIGIAILIFLKFMKTRHLHISMAKTYFILCLVIVFGMIINREISGYSMFLIMGIAMLFTETVEFREFFEQFDNFVFFIAICSLVGFFIWKWNPEWVLQFPNSRVGGAEARNLYFSVIPTSFAISKYRNYGIFREPAMLTIYLGLAMLRQMFYVEKVSIPRMLVYILSFLLTRSMTGIIAGAVAFMIWFLDGKWTKSKKVICVISIIVIAYFCVTQNIGSFIMSRLNRAGADAHSINSRIASITVGMYVFLQHIPFGAGAISSSELFQKSLPLLGYDTNLTPTNMVTYLLSSFGIIFGLAFILGMWGFSLYSQRSKLTSFGIFLVVLMLLCSETMTYSCTIYIIMFYGVRGWLDKTTYKCYSDNRNLNKVMLKGKDDEIFYNYSSFKW